MNKAEDMDNQLDGPTADAVRAELDKILVSRAFRAAESQKRFLRYATEEAIAGRGDQIKEYMIGVEALGRDVSFDPRLDPIVRTQARKLRARLTKYYETEGEQDLVIVEFPKGSYVPVFRDAGEHSVPASTEEPLILPTAPPQPKRRWNLATVALASLFLAGCVAYYAWNSAASVSADRPSIAVVPFLNVAGDKDDEFLSDGLTEELIDSLSQVPGLQVVARTSAFRYKGKAIDVREVGQTLKVRTVLEGTVRKAEERLRIDVQLTNVASGHRLWSGSYDRNAGDVREVQSDISRAIIDTLGVRRDAPPVGPAPNSSAYQSYLRGRYFWNRLEVGSLNTAIEYFEKAIAQDPSFARAYTALADAYVTAPQVATAPPTEIVSKIRAAATKALELDSTLGEAHIDLAICAEYEFDWVTAEKEFKRGLALSPSNVVGHLWYAKYLALNGRKEEVLAQRRLAAELDPASPYAVQAVGGYLSVMGRYDEAIAKFRSALALEPGFGLAHQGLGIAHLLKGNHDEAIAELQTANKLMSGPRRMALLGYTYGKAGRTAEARQILNGFLETSRREPVPALVIAVIYIGLGDKDHAFEWLERAIDQRDLDVTLQWDSLYEPLRSDPRYRQLLRRMKLS